MFRNFWANESGAVTVDWVVLTAAILGLGAAVLTSATQDVNTLADKFGTGFQTAEVPSIATSALSGNDN